MAYGVCLFFFVENASDICSVKLIHTDAYQVTSSDRLLICQSNTALKRGFVIKRKQPSDLKNLGMCICTSNDIVIDMCSLETRPEKPQPPVFLNRRCKFAIIVPLNPVRVV